MEYKFNVSTDEEHKIKVNSNLIYAQWNSKTAYGESEAKFEIRTSFVGQGAKIKITVQGDDYGKIKKIKDKIYNNRYIGAVEIPKDIKHGENVWFEVKLSKQKLKGKSNSIPAAPKPELVKMSWDKKEARRGDVLKLKAEFERVENDTDVFVLIYEYDQDGNHDKITTIPTTIKNRKVELLWEYEYHEDTDEIPSEEELQKYGKHYNPPEYFFVVAIDGLRFGQKQESGLLEFKDFIELELLSLNNEPEEEVEYTVILPDGSEKKGKLDNKGRARIEDVSPGNYEVKYGPDK